MLLHSLFLPLCGVWGIAILSPTQLFSEPILSLCSGVQPLVVLEGTIFGTRIHAI